MVTKEVEQGYPPDNLSVSKQVSVIICVRNGEKILQDCLASTVKSNPGEIVVVDGLSTDNTIAVANSFPGVRVISDEGKGLAYARRVGVQHALGKYILFVGPDNIMDENFIRDFVQLKREWGFDAASVQTRVFEPKTYWDIGLDFRWSCLMGTPGPLKVVGTPSLYDTRLFQEVKFSEQNLGPSDDTDVADQLTAKGFKLGLIPLVVYDQNGWTAATTWNRFKWYGTGDFYYFNKYRNNWTLRRKLFSISHPLRQTWFYTLRALKKFNFTPIPWLMYTMWARYYGWINLSFKARKK